MALKSKSTIALVCSFYALENCLRHDVTGLLNNLAMSVVKRREVLEFETPCKSRFVIKGFCKKCNMKTNKRIKPDFISQQHLLLHCCCYVRRVARVQC